MKNSFTKSFGKVNPAKTKIGAKFGSLTVLKRMPNKKAQLYYKLECECGNIVETAYSYLTRTRFPKRHCGCKLESDENVLPLPPAENGK